MHTDATTTPARTRTTGRSRRGGLFVAGWALAATFAVTTVLLAVVAAELDGDADAAERARGEVAEAAGRFAEALTTYDHRAPDASRDAVLGLSAAPFTEQYEAALPAIQEGLAASSSVSSGSAREVFVAEVGDDGTATAVVEYDRVLDGASGRRTESNRYLRLGLVELDGRWRVNDVIDLNVVFANAPPAVDETGATPTTTG